MASFRAAASVTSARPEITAALMAETGLDETRLRELVVHFYDKVRTDALLGPIFAERIANWAQHLDRMATFWSSVALMTGRYHGRPVPAHTSLPARKMHFDRWLELFREAAQEVCTTEGAAHVIERAERIALSLRMVVEEAQAGPAAVPFLR